MKHSNYSPRMTLMKRMQKNQHTMPRSMAACPPLRTGKAICAIRVIRGCSSVGLRICLAAMVALAAGCSRAGVTGSLREGNGDYVVLLHGMNRTHRSMHKLEDRLSQEGYSVLNLDYPSRKPPLEQVARQLDEVVRSQCTNANRKVHFVTHSYGGIVVRRYARQYRPGNLGRVVMLGPPNAGCELVEDIKGTFLTRIMVPPAGRKLGTATNDIPKLLGRVDFELGVLAGDRSVNPLYSALIGGKDDGKIAVNDTKVKGMKDFRVVHATHTFMMRNETVIRQTLRFLEHGRFAL